MREKAILKMIKKALKQDHLYSDEELSYMKKEMINIESLLKENKKKTSKGFGTK